jgi:hypothetical protein
MGILHTEHNENIYGKYYQRYSEQKQTQNFIHSYLTTKSIELTLIIYVGCIPENHQKKKDSVACVCDRTIPTERPPLSAELVPPLADRGCHVVSVMDPYGRILGFLNQSPYFFFQVAPQLYSRGWVNPVPDPLLFRKSGSAGNRTRTSGSVARNSDH